ncbi:MAG: Cna B domain protein, partial [Oscillospiraceae bacterium]|nr:Cna B domain protein [Oscillospiraceae bacterium]
EFTVNEDGSVTEVIMKDDTTKVKISKIDITNEEELPGAKLQVIDEDENIIDEWISGKEPHLIEGKLIAGKTYILRETIAPDGYVLATDVEFTVNEDGTITEVVMKDDTTKVKISKQDMTTGKELPGAKLQVIDEDSIVIEEWTSTDEPHFIEGRLTAGKTYILHEITAPDGYEIANDVEFTVNTDGTVTEVVMKDEPTPDVPTTPVVPTTPTPTPSVSTPSVSTPTPVTSTPATGDTGKNPVAVTMCIVGLCGLALTIVMLRKKDQK